MNSSKEENAELSPTSPGDDSDGALSPVTEGEPNPGIDGAPVRCMFTSARIFQMVLMDHFVFRDRVRRTRPLPASSKPVTNSLLQADRTEPYTRITPFQEKHDTSIE
jgi:phosphatidylserine synthase 2